MTVAVVTFMDVRFPNVLLEADEACATGIDVDLLSRRSYERRASGEGLPLREIRVEKLTDGVKLTRSWPMFDVFN